MPVVERSYAIAGRSVRVRYAAPEIAERFAPALARLETAEPSDPDFTLECWDRAATGVVAPTLPWSGDDSFARGQIRGWERGPVRAWFEQWMGLLYLHDPQERVAVACFHDAALVPPWMERAPLRLPLGWFAADRGMVMAHGAAVGTEEGVVLLSGASGAGKSTTALACLDAGMLLLADDACILEPHPTVRAHAVYGRAKLEPDALTRLPRLRDRVEIDPTGQAILDPGVQFVASAPLRAVLVPSVGYSPHTEISDASASKTLLGIAPSTLIEANGSDAATLGILRDVVKRTPCFEVRLGSDLDGVVAAIRGILA